MTPAFQIPHSFWAYSDAVSESCNSCFGKLTNKVNKKWNIKRNAVQEKNDEILKFKTCVCLRAGKLKYVKSKPALRFNYIL